MLATFDNPESPVLFVLQDEEPLNSDDDVSDDDPTDLFDTENVVVCQFDKVNSVGSQVLIPFDVTVVTSM